MSKYPRNRDVDLMFHLGSSGCRSPSTNSRLQKVLLPCSSMCLITQFTCVFLFLLFFHYVDIMCFCFVLKYVLPFFDLLIVFLYWFFFRCLIHFSVDILLICLFMFYCFFFSLFLIFPLVFPCFFWFVFLFFLFF